MSHLTETILFVLFKTCLYYSAPTGSPILSRAQPSTFSVMLRITVILLFSFEKICNIYDFRMLPVIACLYSSYVLCTDLRLI